MNLICFVGAILSKKHHVHDESPLPRVSNFLWIIRWVKLELANTPGAGYLKNRWDEAVLLFYTQHNITTNIILGSNLVLQQRNEAGSISTKPVNHIIPLDNVLLRDL